MLSSFVWYILGCICMLILIRVLQVRTLKEDYYLSAIIGPLMALRVVYIQMLMLNTMKRLNLLAVSPADLAGLTADDIRAKLANAEINEELDQELNNLNAWANDSVKILLQTTASNVLTGKLNFTDWGSAMLELERYLNNTEKLAKKKGIKWE